MKLKDISRTATFAWDPSSASAPLIVTGAVAGALDESFSNESQLEIWSPKLFENEGDAGFQGFTLGGPGHVAEGSVTVASRFNRLAWSQPSASPSGRGMIGAGMETGEIFLYDPVKLLAKEDAQVFRSDIHTGPVRGLDFNPIQKNLLLSGAVNAELYIHDLNNLGKPIPPGPLSTKLNEITALQWNTTVSRVFAASSSSGFTSVWDLKAGKEIVSLQYGGGAAKGDSSAGAAGLQMGKRRGMSDVCWHPEQATRLITASEDDESPIIMLWDLRNTRAPERILSGHTKGVLSVSWCKQDPDLLVSCGKDNRSIIWNPQTGDIVGELPTTSDWAFQAAWCPRNPNILATASFDGHIGLHSLQATRSEENEAAPLPETATADDIFSSLGQSSPNDATANVQSLSVAPKWMRRPASASFGYGGALASVSNLPGASGKHQSSVVHLRHVVTEETIVERANALDQIAGDKEKLSEFSSGKSDSDPSWKALHSLFQANSRDELVALLGFSKEEVARHVQETVKKVSDIDISVTSEAPPSPQTPKKDDAASTEDDSGAETPKVETPATGLFDDDGPVTPASVGGETDFFASMASGSTLRNPQLGHMVPHLNAPPDSSVAATAGSGPSSVRSEIINKDNTFHIYPPGESDEDKLITKALVLGDFKSAVDLCLASERYADALLLAVRGGPELLQATQKAYFTRQTLARPFLRVFQSIVTEDLADIVQNADLGEWRVVFVVLCTFAKESEFANLADQLGQRLQFKWQLLAGSDSPEAKEASKVARQDATLCYLAARSLEHVVSIWIEEMHEDEAADASSESLYSAHAQALQSFVEKVTVFQASTGYVDKDLSAEMSDTSGARTYPLAGLYDRFYEYADLLATQGLVDIAAKYIRMTPKDYNGVGGMGQARDRLLTAAGVSDVTLGTGTSAFGGSKVGGSKAKASTSNKHAYAPSYGGGAYGAAPSAYPQSTSAAPPFQQTTPSVYAPQQAPSNPYAPTQSTTSAASNPYAPPSSSQQPASNPYALPPSQSPYAPPPGQSKPPATSGPSNPYAPSGPAAAQQWGQQNQAAGYGTSPYQPAGYGSNGYGADTQSQGYGSFTPAAATIPPPPRGTGAQQSPMLPGAQQRDVPGWNDAPSLNAPKRPASSTNRDAPKPITSPFPMSADQPMGYAPTGAPPPGPPARGASHSALPPPPKGARPPSANQNRRQSGATSPPPISSPPMHGGPPPQAMHFPQQPQQQQQQQQHQQQQQQHGHQQHAPHYAPPPQAQARPPPPRGSVRAGPPPPGAVGGPPPRALSPLGPGGGNRPMPSMMGAGGRIGGPPPPGMAGGPPPPGMAGGPAPPGSSSTQPPAHTPTPPPREASPQKPRHPAGDRSHIPQKSRPIFEGLSNELNRVKNADLPAHLKRIVEDTDRRLNRLFDDLNNEVVAEPTLNQLGQIVQAISARDANGALALHVDLLTSATGDISHWAPGVKQLIRLGI